MVLVIAGDISVADARRYAQRYYSALPGGTAPARNWPHEPPFRLERHATMHDAKAHEPWLIRQYTATSAVDGATAKSLPLSLFAEYLGGGQTSFLYEKLVLDEKLASHVDVSYDPFTLGPALLRISAIPAPGIGLDQLEQALDNALTTVVSQPPDEAAFARAKTKLKAEVIFAQDGLSSLANVIAQLYALGLDEQYFYEWPTNIEKVTAAEMRAAGASVVLPAKRVTGYLLPAVVPTEAPHAP